MTRLTKLAAVYLLLGLVATWAVAWGSAMLFEPIIRSQTHDWLNGEGVSACWGGRTEWQVIAPNPQDLEAHTIAGTDPFADSSIWTRSKHSRGWPLLALRCTLVVDHEAQRDAQWRSYWRAVGQEQVALSRMSPAEILTTPLQPLRIAPYAANGAIAVGHPPNRAGRGDLDAVLLPFMPQWPGLIANMLFYAAVFLGLHQLLGFTRRWQRRRRGRCARCGYDLMGIGSGGCPECGDIG